MATDETESPAGSEALGDRPAQALEIVRATRRRWTWLLANLDTRLSDALAPLRELLAASLVEELARRVAVTPGLTVFHVIQERTVRRWRPCRSSTGGWKRSAARTARWCAGW